MFRLKSFIAACLILLAGIVTAFSAQTVVWEENYGGEFDEKCNSGVPTADGGYLILGSTFSHGAGEYDIYLIKINSYGDTLWTRTYGGAKSEYGYDIAVTTDNSYVIVGSTRSFGGGKRDVYLLKIDPSGNVIWSKTYGGIEDDEGRSVRITHDNGLIICGTTNSSGAGYGDLFLIRADSDGDTLWTRTCGGTGGESGYAVRELTDRGFAAVGATGTFGDGYSAVYVVRTDSLGDSIWARAYGGAGADFGYSIEESVDKGLMVVGATASFGAGYSDIYLIKLDSLGISEWQRTYGGVLEDRGYSLQRGLDGNYLLAGASNSYGAGNSDVYLLKITPTGDTIWTDTYGGPMADYGRLVLQDGAGDYVIMGESRSYSAGGADVYLVKISGEMTPVNDDDIHLLPSGVELAQNYPNPFNMSTTITYDLPRHMSVELAIFNILGQKIKHWSAEYQSMGTHSIEWDGRTDCGDEAAAGIYFYRLQTHNTVLSRKMVFLK